MMYTFSRQVLPSISRNYVKSVAYYGSGVQSALSHLKDISVTSEEVDSYKEAVKNLQPGLYL